MDQGSVVVLRRREAYSTSLITSISVGNLDLCYRGLYPQLTTPDPRSRSWMVSSTPLQDLGSVWRGSRYFYHRYLSSFLYRADPRSRDH